jgi:hypothetical protein
VIARGGQVSYRPPDGARRSGYVPVVNGRPGTGPRSAGDGGYVWRAPGWQQRARRAGISPGALRAADAAAAQPGRRKRRPRANRGSGGRTRVPESLGGDQQ